MIKKRRRFKTLDLSYEKNDTIINTLIHLNKNRVYRLYDSTNFTSKSIIRNMSNDTSIAKRSQDNDNIQNELNKYNSNTFSIKSNSSKKRSRFSLNTCVNDIDYNQYIRAGSKEKPKSLIHKIHRFIDKSPCKLTENYINDILKLKENAYKRKTIKLLESIKYPNKKNKVKKNSFSESFGVNMGRTYTLAVRLDKTPENLVDLSMKKTLSENGRLKIKFNIIKWVINYKSSILERILRPLFMKKLYDLSYKKTSKDINDGINLEEFTNFLKNDKITKDTNLIKKLFWIIDENGDNSLQYNEIVLGLEVLQDTEPNVKYKSLFKLTDFDNTGYITKSNYFKTIRTTIFDYDDTSKFRRIFNIIFKKYSNNGKLSFNDYIKAYDEHPILNTILKKNFEKLKFRDRNLKNDLLSRLDINRNYFLQSKAENGFIAGSEFKIKQLNHIIDTIQKSNDTINSLPGVKLPSYLNRECIELIKSEKKENTTNNQKTRNKESNKSSLNV